MSKTQVFAFHSRNIPNGWPYRKWLFAVFFLLIFPLAGFGQQGKELVKTLASPKFNGRGYYRDGDTKAARFISSEFRKAGLIPVRGNWYQDFTFPVNSFPGKVDVVVGNRKLVPGKDFIVSPSCPTLKGTFRLNRVTMPFPDFSADSLRNNFLMIDKTGVDSAGAEALDALVRNPSRVKGLMVVEPKKLTWSVSGTVHDVAVIKVLADSFPSDASTISVDIKNRFIPEHNACNVMGYIPGTTNADSFIVVTAHYDHLGRMGKSALFAGANDNASGTAMMIELARYYAKPENRQSKSILFIAFAGEEAGLIGSKYYVDHPLLPLDKIRFLINLDLMGNGDDGVMVVNGEIYEPEFGLLEELNSKQRYVKTIGKRGTARNSDHYWFSQQGVPAFFLYTMGGSKAYHDIYDTADQLPLSEFEDIQLLLHDFIGVLAK